MEIFNVGLPEILIILVLMFILLGPKEMVLTANRIGTWVRNFLRSPMWREIWGISQDIRELPKKIVSETGLDETLAEVKKTTQETANEINRELKDAADAARVPEAEHMRVELNAVPAAGTQPSIGQSGKDFADKIAAKLDVASTASPVDTPAGLEIPAAELTVADEAPPAPKRRGRPRKVTAVEPIPAVEQPEAETLSAADQPVVDEAPVEAPKRRGRPRKVPAAMEQPASDDLQAVEEQPVVKEPAVVVEKPSEADQPPQTVSGGRAMPVMMGFKTVNPVAPKPEVQPQEESTPAVVPVDEGTIEQAAPKRRGRPRKEPPAVVAVAEENLPAVQEGRLALHDNGDAAGEAPAVETPIDETPAKKPRKLRSTSQKAGSNGSAAEESGEASGS